MKGKPKYKLDDIVQFEWNDEYIVGSVYVIDPYGCFEFPNDVCYDIMDNENNILYKHITESDLKSYNPNPSE